MRLPFLRFTIRRLMTVVAIVAILVTAGKMAWRSAKYWKLATYHQQLANICDASETALGRPQASVGPSINPSANLDRFLNPDPKYIVAEEWAGIPKGRPIGLSAGDFREIEEEVRRAEIMIEEGRQALERDRREINLMGAYHARLSREYRRAALRPWLPIVINGTLPK